VTRWRPPQAIRVISIALIRRGDEILVSTVRRDDGTIKGWRPPGGGVEFGESAEAAVRREIVEELGESLSSCTHRATLENIFTHEGATGHEVVFVHEVALRNASAYEKPSFHYVDGQIAATAEWIATGAFITGKETLFPDGLAKIL
jgi:8-oxo-dGTP pyrophosphatase MutT (NUDIX family)